MKVAQNLLLLSHHTQNNSGSFLCSSKARYSLAPDYISGAYFLPSLTLLQLLWTFSFLNTPSAFPTLSIFSHCLLYGNALFSYLIIADSSHLYLSTNTIFLGRPTLPLYLKPYPTSYISITLPCVIFFIAFDVIWYCLVYITDLFLLSYHI